MPSNGTPKTWTERAAAQPPRRLVVSERPPLDPDPLHVEGDEAVEERLNDIALLVGVALFFGGLTLLAVLWPRVAG